MKHILSDFAPLSEPPQGSHWHSYARFWNSLDSPLRPHRDDISIYADELGADSSTLLLGVTPEIGVLNLTGIAVDNNVSMIQAVWPNRPDWRVVSGDWLNLPLQLGAVSQAVGDGSLCLLRYPHDYRRLFAELKRVMRPPGKLVLRLFVAPLVAETPDRVKHEVLTGKVQSFHALKWRLAMSLAASGDGVHVHVGSLLATVNALFPDRQELLCRTGWSGDVFDTVDVYSGSDAVLSFPTLDKLDGLLRHEFETVRYRHGAYELAERCPIAIAEGMRAP